MIAASPDRIATADQAIAMLSDVATKVGAAGDEALAEYCLAAGEAFRLGKSGSPRQAQQFLTAALIHARMADDADRMALAALRIGFANVTTNAIATRGARRSEQAPAIAAQITAASYSESPCDELLNNPGSKNLTIYAFKCAIAQSRAHADFEVDARASLRLGRLLLDNSRKPAEANTTLRASAARYALEGLAPAARIADPHTRMVLVNRLAETAIEAGQTEDSRLAAAVTALRVAGNSDPENSAVADAIEARLALAHGKPAEAAALLRHAIFAESQTALPLRLPDLFLLLAQAEPDQRSAHLTAAFRALTGIRPLLGSDDPITEESNFALRVRPVFEATVENLFTIPGANDTVERIDDVQRVVEAYRQAELQDVFGSECVPPRAPVRPSELKPGEVLLYPILLPDRVELLYAEGASDRSGAPPRYHRLPPNRDFDRAKVLALVDAVVDATSHGNDTWREPSAALYRVLIAPVADRLQKSGTLVVIPDGPLSALPFSALLDAGGHFLVEQTRVTVVPSLAYAQPGDARAGHDPLVVAVTLERAVSLPAGTFPELTGTGEEGKFAVGAGRHNVLIRNFHRGDLVKALTSRPIDVLHLATHASFNGRSYRAYIVADGEAISITDLRDLIGRGQTRGEQLDLLVLSACETAVGDDSASMGLAGVAVQSGARSALASLWEVNDLGTSELMKAFYAQYRAGASKAEALRAAQLALIKQGGDFADPNIWAAFTLLGSWR